MKIGIAIVHYGEQVLLDNCLASLEHFKQHHQDFAVDDFQVQTFDCNKENIGFSRGNNRILKEMLHDDVANQEYAPEWILLLNNDTTLPRETIDVMHKTLNELPKEVGVVGFQIRSMADPDFIHHAGTDICYPAGVHKSGSVRLKQHTKRTSERWVTFAAVLIRKEVFEDIGLLDSNMFNYFSDSDFCFRARHAGWKIIYEPTFVVYHKIGSSQNPSEVQMKMIQMDSMVFENKWINGKQFFDLEHEVF